MMEQNKDASSPDAQRARAQDGRAEAFHPGKDHPAVCPSETDGVETAERPSSKKDGKVILRILTAIQIAYPILFMLT